MTSGEAKAESHMSSSSEPEERKHQDNSDEHQESDSSHLSQCSEPRPLFGSRVASTIGPGDLKCVSVRAHIGVHVHLCVHYVLQMDCNPLPSRDSKDQESFIWFASLQ